MPKLIFAIQDGSEDDIQSMDVFAGSEVVANLHVGGEPDKIHVTSYTELMVDATFDTFKKAKSYVQRSLKVLEAEESSAKDDAIAEVAAAVAKKKEKKERVPRTKREDVERELGRIRIRLNQKQTALLDERAPSPSLLSAFQESYANRVYYPHDGTSVMYVTPDVAMDILRWSREQEGFAFTAGSKALARTIAKQVPDAEIEQAA